MILDKFENFLLTQVIRKIMEIIPLITMKKRKILQNNFTEREITDKINEIDKVYILDLDGIQKDKPNLCTIQRLSPTHDLYVDSGPRDLGDVVDLLMAGAFAVTIRRSLYPQLNIENIREITENKIYENIEAENEAYSPFINGITGFVNFSRFNKDIDLKFEEMLKQINNQKEVYVYEHDPVNALYWEKRGVNTLLVDIEKIEEFKVWMAKRKLSLHSSSTEVEKQS